MLYAQGLDLSAALCIMQAQRTGCAANGTGGDAIDADAVVPPLHCQAAREAVYGRLSG